jgi:hypothetical protein
MMKMSTSGCLFGAPIDGGGDREADGGGVDSVGRAYTVGRLRLPFVEHDRADGVESQPEEGARGWGGDRGARVEATALESEMHTNPWDDGGPACCQGVGGGSDNPGPGGQALSTCGSKTSWDCPERYGLLRSS